MRKVLALVYGIAAYSLFFVTFCYAIGFVGNLLVPKSIDSGAAAPIGPALLVNTALLTLFAVQHSGMARRGFKRWWMRFVSPAVERSTYVVFASCALLLLFALWRPIPRVVWQVNSQPGAAVLWSLFALGWGVVFVATFMIGHFELFGVNQVWRNMRNRSLAPDQFRTPLLYRFVRHPIMLGFLIAFWSTPVMTAGHLLFSIATTGYILVAVQLEERDLVAHHGEAYRRYRREVPAFVPLPKRSASTQHAAGTQEAGAD